MTTNQIKLLIELSELEGKLTWLIVNKKRAVSIRSRIDEIKAELLKTAIDKAE